VLLPRLALRRQRCILETPGEPASSTLTSRPCHGPYRLQEYKGLIFMYLGPPRSNPNCPLYDMPGHRTAPGFWIYPVNWLQARENGMDPAHTAFLHTIVNDAQFTEEFGILLVMESHETPAPEVYVSTRRVGDIVWVRIAESHPSQHPAVPLELERQGSRARLRPTDDDDGPSRSTIHTVAGGRRDPKRLVRKAGPAYPDVRSGHLPAITTRRNA